MPSYFQVLLLSREINNSRDLFQSPLDDNRMHTGSGIVVSGGIRSGEFLHLLACPNVVELASRIFIWPKHPYSCIFFQIKQKNMKCTSFSKNCKMDVTHAEIFLYRKEVDESISLRSKEDRYSEPAGPVASSWIQENHIRLIRQLIKGSQQSWYSLVY
jgi:hypothetical protein